MKWKERFSFPIKIKPGMRFKFNGNLDICGDWDSSVIKGVLSYPLLEVVRIRRDNKFTLLYINRSTNIIHHSMSYDFLKKHFNYIGEK